MLVPFHVMEHENFTRATRQVIHRTLDRHPKVRPTRHRSHLHLSFRRLYKPRFPRSASLPATNQVVHRDSVEPGRKSGCPRKGTQLLPDPNEDVLDLIVDVISSEEPPRERIHPGGMPPVQSFKGDSITSNRGRHIDRIRRLDPGEIRLIQGCVSSPLS